MQRVAKDIDNRASDDNLDSLFGTNQKKSENLFFFGDFRILNLTRSITSELNRSQPSSISSRRVKLPSA